MSSIFKRVDLGNKESSKIEDALKRLTELFENITEFSANDLKAISLLYSDDFFKEKLDIMIANKKHLKRRYVKELLKALQTIASAYGSEQRNSRFNLFGGNK